jgi:hypothetical protein
MAKRKQRRERPRPATTDYSNPDGDVLTLRDSLSAGTLARLQDQVGSAAASADDVWRRRTEMLFECLAVRWTIAELPLTRQKDLIGRYRLADEDTQRWVRETIDEHRRRKLPELDAMRL